MGEAYCHWEFIPPPNQILIKNRDAWSRLPEDVQNCMRKNYGTKEILNEVGRCVAHLSEKEKEQIVQLACLSMGVEIEFVSLTDESPTAPADPSARP